MSLTAATRRRRPTPPRLWYALGLSAAMVLAPALFLLASDGEARPGLRLRAGGDARSDAAGALDAAAGSTGSTGVTAPVSLPVSTTAPPTTTTTVAAPRDEAGRSGQAQATGPASQAETTAPARAPSTTATPADTAPARQPEPAAAAPAPETTTTTAPARANVVTTIGPAPAPAPVANGRTERGRATWFNAPDGTCAHRTIAFGTVVKVTRVSDGATTTCVVDQWGPAEMSVVIDLSMDTFEKLAPAWVGVIEVVIEW